MRQSPFIILFYTLIILLLACTRNESANILKNAQKLVESKPDSALLLIDSIIDPKSNLSEEEYMQFLIAHTQIYYKNYLPIDDDTLIFNAVDFYKKHNSDPNQTALAYYYGGVVLRTKKKLEDAMELLKNAESFAKKSQNLSILGLINFNIADLLAEQGKYDKALSKYRMAAKYYQNDLDRRALAYSSMGRMHLFNQNTDSALFYFKRGLKIAEELKNKSLQRQLAESLSVAYEDMGKYRDAQKYLNYSLSHNTDKSRLPRYHLNFAIIYNKISLDDSVTYFTDKLKGEVSTIKDNYLRASILNFLIDYEKRNHRITSAFDYQTERMTLITQIMKERENQSIYKIEKRFNYEQIQKQYYKTLSVKQRWIIILMGIVIIGGISFLFYRTKQKNKELSIKDKINTLTQMNSDLESMKINLESRVQKKQSDLRKELLWRFDITKKFLKLNEEISKKGQKSTESGLMLKQFNTAVYGQSSLDEQWEVLHKAFRQARPNYSEDIKKIYPELTETEFRIAILTYAEFSIKEIALILKHSPHTIQARRSSLRKKLGIDKWGDIGDFMDDKLS